MDVMRHKIFGCSAVYDMDFLRRDESNGFGGKMDKICLKAADFGQEMDNIWIFCLSSLKSAI